MQIAQTDHVDQHAPEVPVLLELDASLSRIVATEDALHEKVRVGVQQALEGVMEVLGIPGVPVLQISPLHEMQAEQFARLSVHGQPCSYPDEVIYRIDSYMTDSVLSTQETLANILQRLQRLFETADMPEEKFTNILIVFFGFACREIVSRQPSMLLNLTQVETFIDFLAQTDEVEEAKLDAEWLLPILRTVLDLKISLVDMTTVKRFVKIGMEQRRSQQDIAEDIIDALKPKELIIYMSQAYLKELTTFDEKQGPAKFVALRKSLLDETGLIYPSLHFVAADGLDAPGFAFKINHLTLLPWVGLHSDDPGLLDHFINCLSTTLKENNHCFVHRHFLQDRLDQFRPYFPSLIQRVEAKISLEQMTRVLRALVAKDISIRDMRFVLEQFLDFMYISADPSKNAGLDLQFTASGQVNASWFKEPMHMVDYVEVSLQRKASSTLSITSLASS